MSIPAGIRNSAAFLMATSFAVNARRRLSICVFVAAAPVLLFSFQNQTITVAVYDPGGSRIPGSKARLLSMDRVYEVKAKADGEVHFDGVVPGTYDLEVSASGFRPKSYPDLRIPGSGSLPVSVSLDLASIPDHCGYLTTLDYQAIAPEARTLSGLVVDEDNRKGIRGVKVELINSSAPTKIVSTVSGVNGKFTFSDLPPNRYSLRASRNGYEPTEVTQFLVPRENLTILHLALDKRGHMHICQ